MDPKGGQILDPKLKEAYDRVMGASIPQAAPKPPSPPPAPSHPEPAVPAGHPDAPKTPEHHDAAPAQHVAPPAPTGHAPAAPAQSTQGHATMSFSNGYVAPHPENKAPVSGPLLIFAGVIFLLVYTLFWMKWFGMTIPFLP